MGILTFEGIDLEQAPKDALPVCPHCKQELKRLWYKAEGVAGIGQKQIAMCPFCRAFLSYALWRS